MLHTSYTLGVGSWKETGWSPACAYVPGQSPPASPRHHSRRPTLVAAVSAAFLLSTVAWCGEAQRLAQAITKQSAALARLEGTYKRVKHVKGRFRKVTKGSFLLAEGRVRCEYTQGGRDFAYAFDGVVVSSLRSEDFTGRLMGNRRMDASGRAPGIGKPDINPRALTLTAFGEPLANYEFHDRSADLRFANPAIGYPEVYKILITGIKGTLLEAETVTIYSSGLPPKAPPPVVGKAETGHSPTPRSLPKIKFTFDTAKGYALVQKETYSPSGELTEKIVVKELSALNGVWLPTKLERIHYHRQREGIRMREEIVFSDVTIPDEIDDRRFELQFSPRTRVTE